MKASLHFDFTKAGQPSYRATATSTTVNVPGVLIGNPVANGTGTTIDPVQAIAVILQSIAPGARAENPPTVSKIREVCRVLRKACPAGETHIAELDFWVRVFLSKARWSNDGAELGQVTGRIRAACGALEAEMQPKA